MTIKTPPMQEVFDNDTRASGGISTFYNRARDQQFVLNYFAEADERQLIPGLKERVDTNNAAIIRSIPWVALEQSIPSVGAMPLTQII